MVLYKIKNWDANFEVSQAKKVKLWTWVAMPVKHDGKGFKRLMAMPNGPALFGAWVLFVQIAAKCKVRGVLADDDGPLSVEDMAIKTGCPEQLLIEMIEVISGPKIGWILVERSADASSALDHRTVPTVPDRPDKQEPTRHRSAGGFFKGLTMHGLADDATVSGWHAKAVKAGLVPNGERDELAFWSAAEKALKADKATTTNPLGLFISIVGGQRRDLLTNDSDERARTRLRDFKARANGYGDAPRGSPPEVDDTEQRRQAQLRALQES